MIVAESQPFFAILVALWHKKFATAPQCFSSLYNSVATSLLKRLIPRFRLCFRQNAPKSNTEKKRVSGDFPAAVASLEKGWKAQKIRAKTGDFGLLYAYFNVLLMFFFGGAVCFKCFQDLDCYEFVSFCIRVGLSNSFLAPARILMI